MRKDDTVMAIFVNNPLGSDGLDIEEDSAAERVGDRIRTIRIARGLSQAELGAMLGLTADRIQKYENGVRKPKKELLKAIASALEVSSLALADPTTSSNINAMFTLFELENKFDFKIEKIGPRMCLSVDVRDKIFPYLKEWCEEYSRVQAELNVATSEDEKKKLIKEYRFWEWSYPKPLTDKTAGISRKARIERKIEELQAELDKMGEDF